MIKHIIYGQLIAIYSDDLNGFANVSGPIMSLSQAEREALNLFWEADVQTFPSLIDKEAQLEFAAQAYESRFINQTGVGLVVLGLIKNEMGTPCPKCVAVKAWSMSLWNEYYNRKAAIVEGETMPNTDFSAVGPMPHSVPELIVEVEGLNNG